MGPNQAPNFLHKFLYMYIYIYFGNIPTQIYMYDYMSVRIQVLECEIHGPTSEFYLGLCSGSEPRSHLKKYGVQTGTIPSSVRVFFFSFLFLSSLLGYLEKGGKKKELKNKRDTSGNLRAAPLEEKFKECYLRWPTNALV